MKHFVLLLVFLLLASCSFDANTNVKSDEVWTEITRRQPLARRQQPQQATPTVKKRGKAVVLAVFDIEDRGSGLAAPTVSKLSDYLAMRLAAAGTYQVVPRDQIKARLRKQKKQSYKHCFDQSCQIEVGREFAAQKTLSTVLLKLGQRCAVTAVVYDLRRATSEGGASAEGPCTEDGILASLKSIVQKLRGQDPGI